MRHATPPDPTPGADLPQQLVDRFKALSFREQHLAVLSMGLMLLQASGGEIARAVMDDADDQPLAAVVVVRGQQATRDVLRAVGLATDDPDPLNQKGE